MSLAAPRRSRRDRFREPAPVRALLREPRWGFVWLFVRLYVGWQLLSSGWHKVYGASSIGWVHDGVVNGKARHGGDSILAFWQRATHPPQGASQIGYGWYRDFLEYMIDHRWNGWFTYLIAYGELLVGIALIVGAFTGVAACAGAFMNFNYMLAGSAGIGPMLFAGELLLLLTWKTAGYVGLDRWLLPALGTPWQPGRLFRRGAAPAPVHPRPPLPARPRAPVHGAAPFALAGRRRRSL